LCLLAGCLEVAWIGWKGWVNLEMNLGMKEKPRRSTMSSDD
jgi:hypothetical protein